MLMHLCAFIVCDEICIICVFLLFANYFLWKEKVFMVELFVVLY